MNDLGDTKMNLAQGEKKGYKGSVNREGVGKGW